MMKTYRYRKHILWMKYLVPIALVVTAIVILVAFIANERLGVGLVATVVLLAEAWVIWWFLGRLDRVGVTLTEDRVVYDGKKERIEMPFEKISEINQPSIRYAGGWLKIQSAGKSVRLTVVLEGIGEFVRLLKDALDRAQLSDRYDRTKLFRFCKTAEYSDQSWERIYQLFGRLILLIIGAAGIGLLLALIREEDRLRQLALFCYPLVGVFLVLTGYVVTEIILGRHFAKAANEAEFSVPERNRALERSVYKWACVIGGAIIVALSVVAVVL